MKNFVFLWLFLLLANGAAAQNPGTSGADILTVPLGVRAIALGGTYAALGDDINVIDYNPAGLARVSKYNLSLDHVDGIAGVEVESLGVAVPTKDYGNFGGQIIFRHMPDIDNSLATDPVITANDIVLMLADAQQFGKISLGGTFKVVVSNLGEKQATTEAIDLGVKIQFLETDFAAVVQNIGPGVQFQPDPQTSDPLPLTYRLAAARPVIVSPSSTLLASAEGDYINDEGLQESVGVEYWYRSVLALRAGYRFTEAGNLGGGFSAGAALRNNIGKLDYEIGYAWRPSQISSSFIASSNVFGLLLWY
jgi:hypothetical protein